MDWRVSTPGGSGDYAVPSMPAANGTKSDRSSDCPHLGFRYIHGGTGPGSTHKPFRPACASLSNCSSTVSVGAYFRYHQHRPSLTSVWLTLVPSGGAIGKGAPILVLAECLQSDFLPVDQL